MKKLILLICVLFCAASAFAQWQYLGLGNAYGVRCLASDGTNLYAGTLTGVYTAPISGGPWTQLNMGLTNTHVKSLAINGADLLAGNFGPCGPNCGIYSSSNGGASWLSINNGIPVTEVYSIVIMGSDIFAGTTNYGVYRSTNNGNSWTQVNTGLTFSVLTALASNGTDLWAATVAGGMYLSTNNGNSWTQKNTGLIFTDIWNFAVNGTTLYASASAGGVFISTNYGASWAPVSGSLPGIFPGPVCMNGSDVFVVDSVIHLSVDNGNSWIAVSEDTTATNVSALNVFGTDLYASCENGVWKRPLAELTGIQENKNSLNLRVSPNPFSHALFIKGTKENDRIFIYDVSGKELIQAKTFNTETEINTEFLKPGFYMLEYRAGNYSMNFKVIKPDSE